MWTTQYFCRDSTINDVYIPGNVIYGIIQRMEVFSWIFM